MFPFEIVIVGTPVSVQAKNRSRLRSWKGRVRSIASSGWTHGEPASNNQLKVTIAFYFDAVTIDTDNIIKPILDALSGVVFADDSQVTDVGSSKRDLNDSFKVRGMSPVLAEGFASNQDFVFVRVDEAPDPRELP